MIEIYEWLIIAGFTFATSGFMCTYFMKRFVQGFIKEWERIKENEQDED